MKKIYILLLSAALVLTYNYNLSAQVMLKLKEINSPCTIANFSSTGSSNTDGMLKGPNYTTYSGIIKSEFKMMQIGNWIPSNWQSASNYTFTDINNMVNWCNSNGIQAWGLWTFGNDLYIPDWLKNGTFTNEQLDDIVHNVIKALLTTNGNSSKVDTWCVMNEMFNDDGTYKTMKLNQLGWEPDQSGLSSSEIVNKQHPVFIRKVLQYFRENTTAKLEIRDYNFAYVPGNNMPGKSKAIYQLLNHLVANNSPVSAVSEQGHFCIGSLSNISASDNFANMSKYIKGIRDLGLEFYVSECDISEGDGAVWNDSKLQQQKIDYNNFVYEMINAGASKFSTWGIRDGNDQNWQLKEHPLMWTNKLVQKPAYLGVHDALSGKTSASDKGFKAINFSNKSSIATSDGNVIKNFKNNEWIEFEGINLVPTQNMVKLRIASAVSGGTIEIRSGSLDGTLLGTVAVPNTGNLNTYTNDVCATIQPQTGIFNLFFSYKNENSGECNFDWFEFTFSATATAIIQAEDYIGKSSSPYVSGGVMNATNSNNWLEYPGVQFNGETNFNAKLASGSGGGRLEIRLGSTTGKLIGTLNAKDTGGWSKYTELTCAVTPVNGVYNVFIVFQGNNYGVCNLDWFRFSSVTGNLNISQQNSFKAKAYPNPLTSETLIEYSLPASANVDVSIFDLTGRKLQTLVNASETAGIHQIRWMPGDKDSQNAKCGIYFCRISSAGKNVLIKLILKE